MARQDEQVETYFTELAQALIPKMARGEAMVADGPDPLVLHLFTEHAQVITCPECDGGGCARCNGDGYGIRVVQEIPELGGPPCATCAKLRPIRDLS